MAAGDGSSRTRRLRPPLPLVVFGVLLASAVFAPPAFASLHVYTTLVNDTSTSISLRGEGEDCWNSDDFGSDINVSPGSSYMYYSSITAPTLLFDPRSKLLSYDVDGDRPESPRGLAILSGFRCERSSARGTGRYHVHIQRGQRCLPANSFVITR